MTDANALLKLYHYKEIVFTDLRLSEVYSDEEMEGEQDEYVIFSILARVHNQLDAVTAKPSVSF